MNNNSFSGIILAGGKSSRLGVDKIFLEYKNKKFIDIIIEKLSKICSEIIISGRKYKNYKSCKDEYNINAPISGLYSGLKSSKYKYSLIVAGDLPFIEMDILKLIISKMSPKIDIVIPAINGYYEPLVAIYSRNILKILETKIKKKQYKISSLIEEINAIVIKEKEIKKIDPKFYSFLNINTKKDYNKILNMEIK